MRLVSMTRFITPDPLRGRAVDASSRCPLAPLPPCRLLELSGGGCENTASGRCAGCKQRRNRAAAAAVAAAHLPPPACSLDRALPPHRQCRWYIADDKGYVCPRDTFNYGTGCCTSGTLHSCDT